MGAFDSSRSRIEVKVEDHSKRVRTTHEEMPQGVDKEAYLARRLGEEVDANKMAYNVTVSYDRWRLSKRH